jgi:KDO2-lipid IV(A) lauroyltransferase
MSGYWSYRFAELMSRYLPGRSAYWVGLRIADSFYRRQHAERAGVIANLRQIYEHQGIRPAEKTLEGMARKTYQYFGKYLVDFFRLENIGPDYLKNMVSFQGLHYLEAARATGRGVLMVTAHFGNWELGGAVLCALGHQLQVIVLPHRLARLEALLRRQRERRGMAIIPADRAVFGTLRALRSGGMVGVLADRDFSSHRHRQPFFGKPACLPRGPAWLGVKSGAMLVPVFILRQEDDTFLFRIHPAIDPVLEGSEAAVQQRICEILEREIGERPHQWFIFEDFWRRREGMS